MLPQHSLASTWRGTEATWPCLLDHQLLTDMRMVSGSAAGKAREKTVIKEDWQFRDWIFMNILVEVRILKVQNNSGHLKIYCHMIKSYFFHLHEKSASIQTLMQKRSLNRDYRMPPVHHAEQTLAPLAIQSLPGWRSQAPELSFITENSRSIILQQSNITAIFCLLLSELANCQSLKSLQDWKRCNRSSLIKISSKRTYTVTNFRIKLKSRQSTLHFQDNRNALQCLSHEVKGASKIMFKQPETFRASAPGKF